MILFRILYVHEAVFMIFNENMFPFNLLHSSILRNIVECYLKLGISNCY